MNPITRVQVSVVFDLISPRFKIELNGLVVWTSDFESKNPSSSFGGISTVCCARSKGPNLIQFGIQYYIGILIIHYGFHGLAVRTLDSESSNPSSSLGGT